MTSRTIAIIHFTSMPHVGGIESLIEMQSKVLHEQGLRVRLIVGSGGTLTQAEVLEIPQLHPSHPDVSPRGEHSVGIIPDDSHPMVQFIARRLRNALRDCSECWVHNVLSVYLNPTLTVALIQLVRELTGLRWIAFCHDLSVLSADCPPLSDDERLRVRPPRDGITYVTDSESRKLQLMDIYGVHDVRVIAPPADAQSWLGLAPESRGIAHRLRLAAADVVMISPSKLLPHKNLGLAVQVLAELRNAVPFPLLLITGAPSPHQPQLSASVRRELLELSVTLGVADNLYLLTGPTGRAPSHAAVRDLMLCSDLVLLTSVDEGFSMPMLEAVALRVPVLCTDIPAFREGGEGVAHFFSLASSAIDIANKAAGIASTPANRRRRKALRSLSSFRCQIEELADLAEKQTQPERAGSPAATRCE